VKILVRLVSGLGISLRSFRRPILTKSHEKNGKHFYKSVHLSLYTTLRHRPRS
jgi:hypothetical protein